LNVNFIKTFNRLMQKVIHRLSTGYQQVIHRIYTVYAQVINRWEWRYNRPCVAARAWVYVGTGVATG